MKEENREIAVVKEMLELVARDDLPKALTLMSEDIDWQSPVTNTVMDPVSWARPRHNRDEVSRFFNELFGRIRAIDLKPIMFIADKELVIVSGSTHGVVESTGNEYDTDWVMLVTVKNGKITKMHQYYDTAAIHMAFTAAGRMPKAA